MDADICNVESKTEAYENGLVWTYSLSLSSTGGICYLFLFTISFSVLFLCILFPLTYRSGSLRSTSIFSSCTFATRLCILVVKYGRRSLVYYPNFTKVAFFDYVICLFKFLLEFFEFQLLFSQTSTSLLSPLLVLT